MLARPIRISRASMLITTAAETKIAAATITVASAVPMPQTGPR